MKSRFKVGDIVTVASILGEQDMRVVEVWCECEPYYLLLTDVDGNSMRTNPFSAYDCTLKFRPEEVEPKKYSREKIVKQDLNHTYRNQSTRGES